MAVNKDEYKQNTFTGKPDNIGPLASVENDGRMSKHDKYINPADYGAIGNDAFHSLASAGYTLASAQAKWPGITITNINTQSPDWCALQYSLYLASQTRKPIRLGDFKYVIEAPITAYANGSGFDSASLFIFGEGMNNTRISTTGNIDALIIPSGVTRWTVQDMDFYDSLGDGVPVSGTAIKVGDDTASSSGGKLWRGQFRSFYNAVDLQSPYSSIDSCYFFHVKNIAVWNHNESARDGGDSNVINCIFAGNNLNGAGGIGVKVSSSGGLKLSNNKMLHMDTGILVDINEGTQTGILQIINNSIEIFRTAGIVLKDTTLTGLFSMVNIVGNEIAAYGYAPDVPVPDNSITIQNIDHVNIEGNHFVGSDNTVHHVVVDADYINIGKNTFRNGSTAITLQSGVSTGRIAAQVLNNIDTPIVDNSFSPYLIIEETFDKIVSKYSIDSAETDSTRGLSVIQSGAVPQMAHLGLFKHRGSDAKNPADISSGDYTSGVVGYGYRGGAYRRLGAMSWRAQALNASTIPSGFQFTFTDTAGAERLGFAIDERGNLYTNGADLANSATLSSGSANIVLNGSLAAAPAALADSAVMWGKELTPGKMGLSLLTEDNQSYFLGTDGTYGTGIYINGNKMPSLVSGVSGSVQLNDGNFGLTSNAELRFLSNQLRTPDLVLTDTAPTLFTNSYSTTGLRTAPTSTIFAGLSDRVPVLTAGYVAFSDGTKYTGESELFYDSSNNRLGVGTATPSSAVDVYTAAANPTLTIRDEVTSATGGGVINLRHSNASDTYASSGDVLGSLQGGSRSGGTNRNAARIRFIADENITASTAAGSIGFDTTPTGSTTPTRKMTIFSDGTIRHGANATDNMTTEADGTIVLNGAATGWLDVFFPMAPPKTTGAGNPTLITWNTPLRGYSFAVGDAHDFDPQEFPHNGKVGATGTWHVHFVSRTNVAATRGINWQLEYSIGTVNGVFAAPTTINVDVTVGANTADRTHLIADIGTFTTPAIASQICCRLTRIASAGTAPANDPVVLGVHFHYEIDTPAGSRQIWTK